MRKDILAIGAIAILLAFLGVAEVVRSVYTGSSDGGTACTMEAKLCPDGSYVGRSGPKCEFAKCPDGSVVPTILTARLNETVTGGGVSLTPTKVLEDSRCPVDVQCIQAGTVRLRATLSSGLGTAPQQEFRLGQLITTEAENVTLTEVSPAPRAGVPIAPADYRFTFSIEKRPPQGILPYQSGIEGTVVLGPTCPVERDPPDPACAPKPYATAITVTRLGSSAAVASVRSDAAGMFRVSLPPGSYTVTAEGGKTLPRCPSQNITVAAEKYAAVTILCDSGIR